MEPCNRHDRITIICSPAQKLLMLMWNILKKFCMTRCASILLRGKRNCQNISNHVCSIDLFQLEFIYANQLSNMVEPSVDVRASRKSFTNRFAAHLMSSVLDCTMSSSPYFISSSFIILPWAYHGTAFFGQTYAFSLVWLDYIDFWNPLTVEGLLQYMTRYLCSFYDSLHALISKQSFRKPLFGSSLQISKLSNVPVLLSSTAMLDLEPAKRLGGYVFTYRPN